ncbi:MAG: Holliday junction branch migration protein RuvA [Chloroflexota bacterium]|nr:Holliday junction branch migration protein RuvA [Chloroflexota bacterium]
MIAGLRGKVAGKEVDSVIVDCGGVLYRVYVPGSALSEVGDEGDDVRLYTYLAVREAAMTLYGCTTRRQLDLFETLLNVTGVGPKVALAIIGTMPVDTLEAAISQGDLMLLTRVPGVGKKLAQRLVLELKGKLDLAALGIGPAGSGMPPGPLAEVADALGALGYSAGEINTVLAKLPGDGSVPVEDLVMRALQQIGR